MTPNVWRMKPWSLIKLPQPWKGFISLILTFILGYILALICVNLAGSWLNMEEVVKHLPPADKGIPTRFLWYHAAEIAGFTLIPFLIWHHYFDDMSPAKDVDSWGGFWFRTIGVGVLMVLNYIFFYYVNFGHWGLGNHHMERGHRRTGPQRRVPHLELLVDYSAAVERVVLPQMAVLCP